MCTFRRLPPLPLLLPLVAWLSLACGGAPRTAADAGLTDAFSQPEPICDGTYGRVIEWAMLEDLDLVEASGIVASTQSPGVLWIHNDSGDAGRLFATRDDGKALGRLLITGIQAQDIEDIARGPCPDASAACLWIADTGNNLLDRSEVFVYAVPEPIIDLDQAFMEQTASLLWRFPIRFPDAPVDIEAMMLAPDGQTLYFFEKNDQERARIYRLAGPFVADQPATLELLGDFAAPGLAIELGRAITAADMHPSGSRMLLRVYTGIFEYRFDANKSVADIDTIEPLLVAAGPLTEPQGEAVAYSAAGSDVWSVSEDPMMNPGQWLHSYRCQ